MSSLSTPISQLLNEVEDPSAQFAKMPREDNRPVQELVRPVTNEIPVGPSQGVSAPVKTNVGKEFFGLKSSDFKSTLVVFGILLIVTSSLFLGLMRSVPSAVSSNGQLSVLGGILVSIIGSLLYLLMKILLKF